MMKTGIVRRIDEIGRYVIPSEIRNELGFDRITPLEIFLRGKEIVIRKYTLSCYLCGTLYGHFKTHDSGKSLCIDCWHYCKEN